MPKRVDIIISDAGGSLVLLRPVTSRGRKWTVEHLPSDGPMLGNQYAIDRRYAAPIVAGIADAGLTTRTS